MTKLRMHKTTKLRPASAPAPKTKTVSDRRITGRTLQARRYKLWLEDPTCKVCKRAVEYPGGFELDHTVPLFMGGLDTEENCQILCMWRDEMGNKQGCHAEKSAEEAKLL